MDLYDLSEAYLTADALKESAERDTSGKSGLLLNARKTILDLLKELEKCHQCHLPGVTCDTCRFWNGYPILECGEKNHIGNDDLTYAEDCPCYEPTATIGDCKPMEKAEV